MSEPNGREGLTFLLILICYAAWGAVLFWVSGVSLVLAIPAMALVVGFHSSLTHEALHGHPFRVRWANETLMFLPLNLVIPYSRFRDLHLAHHRDSILTDPYDDPESNYLDPVVWHGLPGWQRMIYRLNNTLAGRIVLGPALGQIRFFAQETRAALRGNRAVWLAWALHFVGAAIVLRLVWLSPMPIWAYAIGAYLGLGLIKIRTFLEHRAHPAARARTAIVEDRGPLAYLFLYNNLHVVHHMNSKAAWYDLPGLYRAGKGRYLASNEAYVYRSYAQVFRQYFLRAKDPVPHPLWPKA